MSGTRRSLPVLYSDPLAIDSHRVRFVLEEKRIDFTCVDVAAGDVNAELLAHEPSGATPVFADRELALYDWQVIIDYIDERFPHPPLMPMDPVSRAQTRQARARLRKDWDSLLPATGDAITAPSAAQLKAALSEAAELFAVKRYFLSDEFSLLDITLGPLLWRLRGYGIVLDEGAEPIATYAQRLFARPGFQASLSDAEKAMSES